LPHSPPLVVLPAGHPRCRPLNPTGPLDVARAVSKDGLVSLGPRAILAAEILGGRRVSIRIEEATLMFFGPDTRERLRSRPNPLTYDQARKLRGARPAGPPPDGAPVEDHRPVVPLAAKDVDPVHRLFIACVVMLEVFRWGYRWRGGDPLQDRSRRVMLQDGAVLIAAGGVGLGERDSCERRLVRGSDFVPEPHRFG
jgi:hypothetical protein